MNTGRLTYMAIAACILLLAGCTGQSIKNTYISQESSIESLINSLMKGHEDEYVLSGTKGVQRLTTVQGEGHELDAGDSLAFYYSAYVLQKSGISNTSMFATNRAEDAERAKWTLSDENALDIKKIRLGDAKLVKGLEMGLLGVREGEECYILFSGKLGYGKRKVGNVPANSGQIWHIWAERVVKD